MQYQGWGGQQQQGYGNWGSQMMAGQFDQMAYFSDPSALYMQQALKEPLMPNSVVRILFDYIATERGVLSLRAGDVATLLELKEQGWCILKTTAGQEGYFPQSYVEPAGAVAAVGTPASATASNARCEVHGKNRSTTNLMQEPDPMTGGATMRWVCKPGCECKGGGAMGVPSAASQANQAQMLLAAQAAAADYMAKHASGQAGPDGTREWALPGYMTTATAAALSSDKPLTASGLTPQQLKAAAEAAAVILAGRTEEEARTHLIYCPKIIGKLTVLAPYDNKEGAANAITTLRAGETVDLLQKDDKGWSMIRTMTGIQGYYPTAFLKVKEGTTILDDGDATTEWTGDGEAGGDVQDPAQNGSVCPPCEPVGEKVADDAGPAEAPTAATAEDAGDAAVGDKRAREDKDGEEGENAAKAPCA